MLLLLICGVGMVVFGCLMTIKPIGFSNGIVRFSEKSWFHIFEILSRLMFGLMFLIYANQTSYPQTVMFIGGIFCFAGLFLIVIGEKRHKRFALLISGIGKNFRILGLISILCGAGMFYIGWF